MRYGKSIQPLRRCFLSCVAMVATILSVAATCAAQAKPAEKPPEIPWTKDLKTYPGLPAEIGLLTEKFQKNLQYPAPRAQSHLLPLVPESTELYIAIPNYGDVMHQALTIFRQQLEEREVLRDWWQHGAMTTEGPKVLDAVEKICLVSQFLGEEIVVAGGKEDADIRVLVAAEIRKPGLKDQLNQLVSGLSGTAKTSVRILDAQELATADAGRPGKELVVLVRPDFVIGALDVATLRSFSDRLDRGGREFASAPFAQRITQAYAGGVTTVGGVDLQRVLSQVPIRTEQNRMMLERSGFGDMKYLVWDHRSETGRKVSEGELSFTGPRHGVASWLAAPGPMGSLDFVSPKAMMSGTVLLKSPAKMLDDIIALAGPAGAGALAMLAQWEQTMKVSLKEDVLNLLGGEITVEVDEITPPQPKWKAMLRVSDAEHLQQSLTTLLAISPYRAEPFEDGGVSYHAIRIPSGEKTYEIGYTFTDGYLIIGSSRETAVEAVRQHRTGESLGKSKRLEESLLPGQSAVSSILFYEDPVAWGAQSLGQSLPEMAGTLSQLPKESSPAVLRAYGEETAIRETSTTAAFDAGMVVGVVAAIAIPNLLRSRMAANEASAVGSLRIINTACLTYATTYGTGFPRKLSNLGTSGAASPTAAGLIDNVLASGTKSGYTFTYRAVMEIGGQTPTYTIQANPITPGETGQRYFFADQSGVIRMNMSRPATRDDPPLQ
jgi:type IV pilus assembly protein PilA